ncbi:hypothetical protein B0T18DRAFT_167385 [Schizothecium vesticola]|uniref:DUF676 domain-containing protein n=1 Tax=Schizothecium vesticola TaxID=314040 RepID=A0AA40ENK1_9PEZI|nr:hypothetical protein B0T18DRAFT_167385 [Schizothecium vesticola]
MPLHQVYPPTGKEQTGAATCIDIVAVHGLNPRNKKDHAFRTWTKNGRNWLTDDLPGDLPGARIFVYEYNSYPENSDQKQRLVKEALQLLNLIDSRRDDQPGRPPRPLIFIAHSLGGLLVKQCLVKAKMDANFATLFSAVKGLVFFGVPHLGGKDKLLFLGRVAQSALELMSGSASLSKKDESEFLDAITGGSPSSDTLTELFRGINSHCPIVSFYENKPTGKFGIVVDEASAKIGLAGEYIIRLEANHSDMCRFDTTKEQDHESYLLVKKRVQTLFNNALPTPVETPSDGRSFRALLPSAPAISGVIDSGNASHPPLGWWADPRAEFAYR